MPHDMPVEPVMDMLNRSRKNKLMRFGDYAREIRVSDPRQLTLRDVSEHLGISHTLLCDIESNRRKPLDGDDLETFVELFDLNEEQRCNLYDLAARDRHQIPYDLEEIIMYSEIGDMARLALRSTNSGKLTEADWRALLDRIQDDEET